MYVRSVGVEFQLIGTTDYISNSNGSLKNGGVNTAIHLNDGKGGFGLSMQVAWKAEPILDNAPTTPQFGVIQGAGDEGGDFFFIKKN